MFELTTPTKSKLSSVNVRAELHGKEPVPAMDLTFTVEMSNEVLGAFHPAMRSFLYQQADSSAAAQQPLDGVDPVSEFTALRFPKLAPLDWNVDQPGMHLTVDYGLGGESNVELDDCTATDFKIAPKEGGTVELKFKVQSSNPDERAFSKFGRLVKHDVHIVLTAPEQPQQTITEEPAPQRDVRQTPTQAFAALMGQDEGHG